jgi:hypothetical protein
MDIQIMVCGISRPDRLTDKNREHQKAWRAAAAGVRAPQSSGPPPRWRGGSTARRGRLCDTVVLYSGRSWRQPWGSGQCTPTIRAIRATRSSARGVDANARCGSSCEIGRRIRTAPSSRAVGSAGPCSIGRWRCPAKNLWTTATRESASVLHVSSGGRVSASHTRARFARAGPCGRGAGPKGGFLLLLPVCPPQW